MTDGKILKGMVKGLGQIGIETIEKVSEEGQKIIESVITGKELLGLERTSDTQLEQNKQQDKITSQQEIAKIKGEIGDQKESQNNEIKTKERPRNVEEELIQLRRQKEREEEEKQKYYEEQREQQERQKQQELEYSSLDVGSSNPAKQKKSRGSAFANKRKHKPDTDQISATQEFNKGGKID